MRIPGDPAGLPHRGDNQAVRRRSHLGIFGRVLSNRSSVSGLEPFLDFPDPDKNRVWACRDALVRRIFSAAAKRHWRSLIAPECPGNEEILESLTRCRLAGGALLDGMGTTAGKFLRFVEARKAPLLQLPCGLAVHLGHLVWDEKKGVPVPPPLLLHWSVGRLLASERAGTGGVLDDREIARNVSTHLGVPVDLSQVLAIRNGLRRLVRDAYGGVIAPEGNPYRDGFPVRKRRSIPPDGEGTARRPVRCPARGKRP
jgi:hypothetical protein